MHIDYLMGLGAGLFLSVLVIASALKPLRALRVVLYSAVFLLLLFLGFLSIRLLGTVYQPVADLAGIADGVALAALLAFISAGLTAGFFEWVGNQIRRKRRRMYARSTPFQPPQDRRDQSRFP